MWVIIRIATVIYLCKKHLKKINCRENVHIDILCIILVLSSSVVSEKKNCHKNVHKGKNIKMNSCEKN